LWLEGVSVAVAAGMLTRLLGDSLRAEENAADVVHFATTVARRGISWAMIGAALAVWMSLRRGERDRLLRRTAIGLSFGALAGALNGAIYSGLTDLLTTPVDGEVASVPALAVTGAVLGAAIGALWMPRRVAIGCFGGVLGGVLAQLVTNTVGHPSEVLSLGVNCFAIVGLALLAMLTLDVRSAAVTRRAAAAQVARA
jgi:hypothetical protein